MAIKIGKPIFFRFFPFSPSFAYNITFNFSYYVKIICNLIYAQAKPPFCLQVFDRSRKFVGQVKFREQLKRPSGIYLDQEEAALYILNLWGNSMVKYILEKN